MSSFTRRALLKSAAAAVPLATWTNTLRAMDDGRVTPPAQAAGVKRAVLINMLPKELSWHDRFALAKGVGFDGIEMQTVEEQADAEAIAKASSDTGLVIHSVMNSAHWQYPLSSADPEVVRKSVAGMKTSLMNAALWKAGIVLLVPAVVNAETPYADAWERSHRVIREQIVPVAEGLKVQVGIEEVWNKFLLSPLEFNQYVDQFKSPWVKAYFDVGNIVFYGYPQDWIRTLGLRITRLHLKDFKLDRRAGKFDWTNLGEGDIDWQEVRKAMSAAPNVTWVTTEISGGDRQYLTDVLRRVDRFLGGFKPIDASAA
ncbi:MAG TPA: sugar phosphate isomerase/epimerase family protein [Woeseiaceae bacterium]|nr:sugar phosphate isomerase/epimerase family protein [Woeseiaceae bacterium]